MTLQNWRIGPRIAALALILMVFLTALGLSAAWFLNEARIQQQSTEGEAARVTQAIELARSAQVSFKIQVQEWKNTLLRGGSTDAFKKYHDGFRKENDLTQARLTQLRPIFAELGLPIEQVDETLAAHQTLLGQYEHALKSYDSQDPDVSAHRVDAMVKGMDRPPTKMIDDIVENALETGQARLAHESVVAADNFRLAIACLIGLSVATLAASIVLSVIVVRSITTPLQTAVQAARQVADGHIQQQITSHGRDEVAELLQAMNRMSQSLQTVVNEVRVSASMVDQAAAEIAAGNLDLSNRTEQQAANLQASTATMDGVSQGVRHSADAAQRASELSAQASQVAEQGGQVVRDVVETMATISESSTRIADITAVIDSIAFQTNILALNAAVEAARAGEQGRGFAVVASEVRALAQRSAQAAQEIKGLIHTSVSRIERGAELVHTAGDTIGQTVQAVRDMRAMLDRIAQEAHEQANGAAQVSEALVTLDSTMQQNASMVEQAAAASNSLKDQSRKLNQVVAFFQS